LSSTGRVFFLRRSLNTVRGFSSSKAPPPSWFLTLTRAEKENVVEDLEALPTSIAKEEYIRKKTLQLQERFEAEMTETEAKTNELREKFNGSKWEFLSEVMAIENNKLLQNQVIQERVEEELGIPKENIPFFQKKEFFQEFDRINADMSKGKYRGEKKVPNRLAKYLQRHDATKLERYYPPKLIFIFRKIQALCTEFGITTEEEQTKFINSVILSPGYFTLEWALPSPPPPHTFEELPLIKENGEDQHQHH